MPRLDDLIELHASLERLLNGGVNDEKYFQAWFEGNPLVFEVLGYRQWIPHPNLALEDGSAYIPDFLVRDYTGAWFILELKRPDTHVLKTPTRRVDFRSEYSSYIEQCREYSEYFLDASNRERVQRALKIQVPKTVPAVLIASVEENVDRSVVREKLWDRGGKVAAMTYTEVLATIGREVDRHTADGERLPGLAIFFLGIFPEDGREHVLLDYGKDPRRSRVTLKVTKSTFVCQIRHEDGTVWSEYVPRPLVVEFANASQLQLLEFEVGYKSGLVHCCAYLNRRSLLRKTAPGTFGVQNLGKCVIGDQAKEPGSSAVDVVECGEYMRTLTWLERQRVRSHFEEVYGAYLSPVALHRPARLTFKKGQWMGRDDVVSAFDPSSGPHAWYAASTVAIQGTSPVNDPLLRPQTIMLPGMNKFIDYRIAPQQI